jgi:glyoxylase-like metal-dependent hydrolase (beta-lactamase superfamily II)
MISPEEAVPGIERLTCESPPPPGWQRPFFYLVGVKDMVMIDTGYPDKTTIDKIRFYLARYSGRIEKLFITHGHLDHAGELEEIKMNFPPCILAHENEKELMAKRGMDKQVDGWIKGEPEIEGEPGPIKVISTPGHSPGSICLYFERDKVLFTGDLVVGDGTSFVGPPDGNMEQYMASLEKIKHLETRVMLPGHGPVVKNPSKHLAFLIEHRLLREVQILKILQQGPSTAHELARKIYVGLIHPGLYIAAEITVIGHLQKLLKEGKVASDQANGERKYRLLAELPF